MRLTKTLAPLFSLMLMSCLSFEGQTAPAPDEVETAKEKLAALKKKLPEVLNQCVSNATLWPRKYKGRIAGLRLISPNEAKLTIRLDYVPPENPDAPAVRRDHHPTDGRGRHFVRSDAQILNQANRRLVSFIEAKDGRKRSLFRKNPCQSGARRGSDRHRPAFDSPSVFFGFK